MAIHNKEKISIYQQTLSILNGGGIAEYKIPKKVFSMLNLATRNQDEELLEHISDFEQYFVLSRGVKDKNILSCAISSSSINYIKKLLLTSTYSLENQTQEDIKELLNQASNLGKNKCFEIIFEHFESKVDTNMLASIMVYNKNNKIVDYLVKEKGYDVKAQFVSALKEKQLFRQKITLLNQEEQLDIIKVLTKSLIVNYFEIQPLTEEVTYKNSRELLEQNKIVYHSSQESVLDSLITAIKLFENKDYVKTRQVQETIYFQTFKETLKKSVIDSIEKITHDYYLEGKAREINTINEAFDKRLNKYTEILKAISYELFPQDKKMQEYLPFYEKYQLSQHISFSSEEVGAKKRLKI
jgi:hypothetical protein